MSSLHTGRGVSISSSSPSFLRRGSKDWLSSVIGVVHPVKEMSDCTLSGVVLPSGVKDADALTKTVGDTAKLLREEYNSVVSTLRRYQKIAQEFLALRLREGNGEVGEIMSNGVDQLKREKHALRETIDGLNQTLVDQRIKVAELKERNKRYRREKVQLRNDLDAHMAEVNYLTKVAAPAGDPSVVRKIAKLESRNRELVAKCQKLLLATRSIRERKLSCNRDDSPLLRRYRNFETSGKTSATTGNVHSENVKRRSVLKPSFRRRYMLKQRPRIPRAVLVLIPNTVTHPELSPRKRVGEATQTERSIPLNNESKLSSNYQVLVDIKPNDNPSVKNCLKNSLNRQQQVSLVHEDRLILNRTKAALFPSSVECSGLSIDSKLIDAIRRWSLFIRNTECTSLPIRVQSLGIIWAAFAAENSQAEPVAIIDQRKRKKSGVAKAGDEDRRLGESNEDTCRTEKLTGLHCSSDSTTTNSNGDTIILGKLQFEIVVKVKKSEGTRTSHRNTQTSTLITPRYNEQIEKAKSGRDGVNELQPIILRQLKSPKNLIARRISTDNSSNISCLKINRTTCSSPRNVRFDLEIRCLRTEDVDSKASCAKRTEFIQGAHELSRITNRKTIDTATQRGTDSSTPLHDQYSLVHTVYNCFV